MSTEPSIKRSKRCSGKMLFFLTILTVAAAAAVLTVCAKRRNFRLLEENSSKFVFSESYHPSSFFALFAPDDQETRAAKGVSMRRRAKVIEDLTTEHLAHVLESH